MSNYKLMIDMNICIKEYNTIKSYLDVIGKCDELIIILNCLNDKNIQVIKALLKDNNFEIIDENAKMLEKYEIISNKIQ